MLNCCFVSSFPEYVLDRTIVIGKGHEHRVSGYKLARASDFFKNQLKEIRVKELERIKQKNKDDTSLTVENNRQHRSRTRSLSEIEYDRIKVNYTDTFGLEYILSFIHCQDDFTNPNLIITSTNSKSVLKAGLYFKVPAVIEFCLKQIHLSINYDNCWQYYSIGSELNEEYPRLNTFVENFILENFESATNSKEFLKINIEDLLKFLKNDFLNTKQEIKLLPLIDRWIETDVKQRENMCYELLKSLRLGRLTLDELGQVQVNRFVERFQGQCKTLFEWAQLTSDDVKESNIKHGDAGDLITYLHRPRMPRQAIIVVGGWEGNQDDPNFGPSRAIQVYDNRANNWRRVVADSVGLDEGHAYSGCVLHRNKVYVIGGYVSSGPTQTLKMLDLTTVPASARQWRYMSPMHEKRNYITVCLLDEMIYAIGGHNGRARLSSVERYDPAQNHWGFVAAMRQVRSDAGCDSLHGRLYVCGGFDGHHFYASVEMYDPKVDQWTSMAPMGNIRSGVSVITHRQFLFAIGGNDGLQRLRTVERYDPATNRWQLMPPMIRQRSNFCLAVIEDEIYVMGGWSDESNSTIALVEKWQPGLANLWVSIEPLYMPASANCCCAVRGIDSIRDLLDR